MIDTALMQLTDGRPTLRCLRGDIAGQDWGDSAHHSMVSFGGITIAVHELNHPIVGKAAGEFYAEAIESDLNRENISGLSDPPWWKVKIGRWRGAVWIDPESGQAWLCAAGYRREGEATDFYVQFSGLVAAHGADYFLPTQADRDLLHAELRQRVLEGWEKDFCGTVKTATLELLEASSGTRKVEVDLPGRPGDTVGWIEIEVLREDIDGEELVDIVVSTQCVDYAQLAAFQWAEMTALLAIDPHEQRWSALAVSGRPTYSQMYGGDDIATLREHLGSFSAPGAVIPGDVAHRAHRSRLTEATIEGDAVKAMCGSWFVPRQDHLSMDLCGHCETILRILPEPPDPGT